MMSSTPDPAALRIDLHDSAGARAQLTPYGAHLLSWCGPDGLPRLFLSPAAVFRTGTAIRGGVPVIFPQFAGEGELPKHGFARTAPWTVVTQTADSLELSLNQGAASHTLWPYRYRAGLHVQLEGPALCVDLRIDNLDEQPLSFTTALHSYLAVDAVMQAQVIGLQDRHYRDSAAGGHSGQQADAALRFDGEVDRIYFDTPPELILACAGRRLRVAQRGFCDTVVWNPGPAKAATLGDMNPGDWQRFVCIEAAVVQHPVRLAPGASWQGTQRLLIAD